MTENSKKAPARSVPATRCLRKSQVSGMTRELRSLEPRPSLRCRSRALRALVMTKDRAAVFRTTMLASSVFTEPATGRATLSRAHGGVTAVNAPFSPTRCHIPPQPIAVLARSARCAPHPSRSVVAWAGTSSRSLPFASLTGTARGRDSARLSELSTGLEFFDGRSARRTRAAGYFTSLAPHSICESVASTPLPGRSVGVTIRFDSWSRGTSRSKSLTSVASATRAPLIANPRPMQEWGPLANAK